MKFEFQMVTKFSIKYELPDFFTKVNKSQHFKLERIFTHATFLILSKVVHSILRNPFRELQVVGDRNCNAK